MTILARIADRVINRPLLITPEKASVIVQVLAGRIGIAAPSANRFEGAPDPEHDEDGNVTVDAYGYTKMKPYRRSGRTGILSIVGSLVSRGAWIGTQSGLVSYEAIQHQLGLMARDDAIDNAIIDIETPGGEAVRAFETADAMRRLAAVKRTVAVVNGMAASAGYAIASGASEIVTVQSGVSGSIGVVLLHADFSRQLANEGIEPTLIFAGAHKVDGNPFEPLTDTVRAGLQAEVNAYYEQFLATVAAGRGPRLTAAAARATEARTFIGEEAVDAGLADRVGTFEEVLDELRGRSGRPTRSTRRRSMSEHSSGGPGADTPGIPSAEHEAAVAAAREDGAAKALARIGAIAAADGIKGNAARLTAAIEMAARAPAMTAGDVVTYVTTHVAEAPAATADPAATYEAERLGALAQPSAAGGGSAKALADRWATAKRRAGIARH